MIKKIFSYFLENSLFRNSIYLMASSVGTAFFGFLFWLLAARLFTVAEVGLATAIVSTLSFASEFSLFGLKNGLIRYIPKSKTQNLQINTSLNVVLLIVTALTLLLLLGAGFFSKDLKFLSQNSIYFMLTILFVASFAMNQMHEGIFVAYRKSEHVLFKNIIWGLGKMGLPFFLISLGAFGIFISYSLGSLLSFIYGVIILKTKFSYKFNPVIDRNILREIGKFSIGDYLGLFLASLPYFLLPITILNNLGAEEAAFYYIAMQIASILLIIPSAVNQSLFAEGSHGEEDTKMHLVNSLKLTFLLLGPLILLIVFFGNYALSLFGRHYSDNGFSFLRIMAFNGVFIGINQIGHAILHVEKKIGQYILLNFISAFLIIFLSYLLLGYGLIGIGYAFLIGSGVMALIYLFILRRSLR